MTEIQIDKSLDATGLSCPLPLLKAKQALNALQPGQVLEVRATDAGSVRDFKAYADLSSHELISTVEIDQVYIHLLRRGD
jgi:tRNA 2-thiouridine synthesizing protein A